MSHSQTLHEARNVGCNDEAGRVRERTTARNAALRRKVAPRDARADTTSKARCNGKRKSAAGDSGSMATLIAA